MGIVNPHDVFFKEVFSDKDRIRDLIQGVFPDELKRKINLSSLDLDNTSYVDERLKESFPDIVYNCQYRGEVGLKISLLFEHKSRVPDYPQLYFEEERGLRFLESVIRYLFSATELDSQEIIEIMKEISQKGGEKAMTTAIKLREEGRKEAMATAMKLREEGRKEEAIIRLLEGIADILEIRFGVQGLKLMEQLKGIDDIKELENVKEKIKRAESLDEIG